MKRVFAQAKESEQTKLVLYSFALFLPLSLSLCHTMCGVEAIDRH
jgi:hypothetical protein